MSDSVINIAKNGDLDLSINLNMLTRHGLISGATGTGKTFTLKLLAEQLSKAGVPVFLVDVKGDVSGMGKPAVIDDRLKSRLESLKINDFVAQASPVEFWDLYGELGVPIRTTMTDMGPLLLSKVLELNDTQEAVLSIAFRLCDKNNYQLIDYKDLRAVLQFIADNLTDISKEYGNVSLATIASIQRSLLTLEDQGGDKFFGEPKLEIADIINIDQTSRGVISILEANKLFNSKRLYSMFLLWMLSELFEDMPEVGDVDKPKLVFFFDEAHLLFDDISPKLLDRVEQVIRLIRSKGIGIFFITQNPIDIPANILSQLGNKIQHALRAYTPKEQQAIEECSKTYRQNPDIDIVRAVQELAVGEALISVLDEKGVPTIVERGFILPPSCQAGPIDATEIVSIFKSSPHYTKYSQLIDRESAYEVLKAREEESAKEVATSSKDEKPSNKTKKSETSKLFSSFARSALRQLGSQLSRELMRGVLGGRSRN